MHIHQEFYIVHLFLYFIVDGKAVGKIFFKKLNMFWWLYHL